MSAVRSVGSVAAEGDDRTVRMRWTPPSDVRAYDVTSLTIYWCLAASKRHGACAVSLRYPALAILICWMVITLLCGRPIGCISPLARLSVPYGLVTGKQKKRKKIKLV